MGIAPATDSVEGRTMTDIPKQLAKRPQWHGMPVPVTVKIRPDGVPDFTAIDWKLARRLAYSRCCGLCGGAIRGPVAFIGGPVSIANRRFADGPMHAECAEYAAEVCPFVSGDHRRYRDGLPEGRPERMGILYAQDFVVQRDGTIATTPALNVRWVEETAA